SSRAGWRAGSCDAAIIARRRAPFRPGSKVCAPARSGMLAAVAADLGTDVRPAAAGDRACALGVWLASFARYATTACRTVYVGDAPEIALAAATFGVPHPPGYPLHALLGGLFVRLVPAGDPALRANLFSAVAAATAAALVFLVGRRLGGTRAGAAVGAASLALGLTFWSQAVAAEVYAFDAMLFALAVLQA